MTMYIALNEFSFLVKLNKLILNIYTLALRIIIQILLLLSFYCNYSIVYSQENGSVIDSLNRKLDTLGSFEKNHEIFLNSPERIKAIDLIRIVNFNYDKVNLISTENIVKIKASSLNQTGNINIRVKKNDSLWFKISGGFAFISKDAVIANVNRNNFIYFDNLNDKVIEGPTTDNNIGAIARIKCTFDDLMNVMSGTGRIVYSDFDTLSMSEDSGKIVITLKGKNNKFIKYWINADNKYVEQYAYINTNKKEYLKIIYSNYVTVSNGYFARKVEIEKPLSKEYMKIVNETYLTNQQDLNFDVEIPNDVNRVKWQN